jgi:hypothetical protein
MKRCIVSTIALLALIVLALPAAASAADYTYRFSFGSVGYGDGQFGDITGMDYAGGHIYAVDWIYGQVVEFDKHGAFVRTLGTPGKGVGMLWNPVDITIGVSGIWVAEQYSPKLQEQPGGSNEIALASTPNGVYTGDDGALWVCTTGGIKEYTAGSKQLLLTIGVDCTDMVMTAPSLHLLVTDSIGDAIHEREHDGTALPDFATGGSAIGQVNEPSGIAVVSEGIVVAEVGNDRVQILGSAQQVLPAPPDFGGFKNPDAVAEGDQCIFVADDNTIRCYSKAGPPPTVTSFTPTSGPVGSRVVITGTHFYDVSQVDFNGMVALGYTIDSTTQITATVPTGATTGPIRVTTLDGTGHSPTDFTVTQQVPASPTVTSFTPASGPAGTSVTITGTGFSSVSRVDFNGVVATDYTVDSATQIRATVPAGATTGPISVTTPDGTGRSPADFTVTQTSSRVTPVLKKSPPKATYRLTRKRGSVTWTYKVTLTKPGGGAVAGKTVQLQKSANGTKWTTKSTLTTSAAGTASKKLKFKTKGASYWRWYSPETADYTAVAATKTKIVIR